MDRQTVLGFVLIFLVLMVWMWVNSPTPPKNPPPQKTQQQRPDTVRVNPPEEVKKAPPDANPYGRFFAGRSRGVERLVTIETDNYVAKISTKGAVVKEWILKEFKQWDGSPVQLVDYQGGGDLNLLFMTADGKKINSKELFFDIRSTGDFVTVAKGEEYQLEAVLPSAGGGRVVKTFRFKGGQYDVDIDVGLENVQNVIANFRYELAWENGLRYAERNSVDESNFTAAHVYTAGEHVQVDAHTVGQRDTLSHTGKVDWVATNNKYFVLAIIPTGVSEGAYIEGARVAMPDNGVLEKYLISIQMPYREAASQRDAFKVYIGPIDYYLLRSYNVGLENTISLGWTWIIRPISVYVMLPLFLFLHTVIPNWGIVIIIFSIIIKIALHPLTKTSMKSMKKMQALQPMMDEIREKHKDDPQKMNQQIMNLYREYGVNPAGGCLPMLLQFPILIALYNVFRSSIELRQAGFFGWIHDLSIPDTIFTLPFTIPVFGVHEVSGLALLMGITTFIQQKMTVKDPRQKTMIWMMPLMMTMLFNSFPSGLNLYYFVFNILSIGQQIYINKQHAHEPLRKVEQKKEKGGGIFKNVPRFKP